MYLNHKHSRKLYVMEEIKSFTKRGITLEVHYAKYKQSASGITMC